MRKIILIIILFIFTFFNSFSQEIIPIISTGKYEFKDISPVEAKELAIKVAKVNALKKAGISEYIVDITVMLNSEVNYNYIDIFNSITSTEVQGEILVDEIIKDTIYRSPNNNLISEVEIKARIFKYDKEKDFSFAFKVESLESIYKSGEIVEFSFIPTNNGYLNVFYINKEETVIMFPNRNLDYPILNDIPDKIFRKNEIVNFPINKAIKYTLSVPENQNSEESYFLFVFTKEYSPFTKELRLPNILEWIYKIPQDKRSIQYFPITIIK